MNLRVVARGSRLSVLQVKELFSWYPKLSYTLRTISSFGDVHKNISLLDGEAPENIFTRELDDALLKNEADIAVHSAKDLPYPLPDGIEVIALLNAFDSTDSLVSRDNIKLRDLQSGSRVGTSSPLRRKELLALRPDIVICGVRGCIEERIRQVDTGLLDAVIVATCALKRLGLTDRISEVVPFETHPLQGYLAVTARKGSEGLKSLFYAHDVLHTQGQVQLVGFGPVNPEWLTVAAAKSLSEADVIYYDDLLDKQYIERINATKIYVGKRSGHHSHDQQEIQKLLLKSAREGKGVVRLKGGDPSIFAHSGEEVEYLQSNLIKVSIIPGITAASAVAATTHIPLTHRALASSVAFVSGHDMSLPILNADTLVYYMGAAHLGEIAGKLIKSGRKSNTQVVLVYNASMPDEKIYYATLGELCESTYSYPTPLTVIIGDVVSLHNRRAPASKPLVLVTGLSIEGYEQYGKIVHTPLIQINPVVDKAELMSSVNAIHQYDYLLFTSRYAVKYWMQALFASKYDARALSQIKLVVIGHVTGDTLLSYGLQADYRAEEEDSEGVLRLFSSLPKGRVLFPRSDKALPTISQGLSTMGLEVDTVVAYNNVFPQNPRKVNLNEISTIVFTSPSCIQGFLHLYGRLPLNVKYVTQGKTTQQYLEKKKKEQ